MIQTAESLVGDYVWTNYDILVLPPSFPYGGMENPCLTFCTPTIISGKVHFFLFFLKITFTIAIWIGIGDQSLVDVIIHEISHSWTGNLVTNKNWENFWLNEGFTMFLERKICGRMNNSELYRQFDCLEGYRYLLHAHLLFFLSKYLVSL